jgi:hypothetical protein
VSQLQQTVQQQGIWLNNAKRSPATNANNNQPKEAKGHRGRDLSVQPKDTSNGRQNGKNKAGCQHNSKKRKHPAHENSQTVKTAKGSNNSLNSSPGPNNNPQETSQPAPDKSKHPAGTNVTLILANQTARQIGNPVLNMKFHKLCTYLLMLPPGIQALL